LISELTRIFSSTLFQIITTTEVMVCTAPKRGEYRLTH